MPLFAVLFEDEARVAEEVRRRHMSAHLAFLERNAGLVRAAGPLQGGEGPAGGLWLVEADDSRQVDELVRDDPFWSAGLRRSVRVLTWTRVFVEGIRCAKG
jgi:uncharacterized protein YciI